MDYRKEYERWLDSPALSEAEWKELDAIAGDETEIKSRFRGPLEFGTAGLRGTMGVGLNRMNVHVVRWATQAFAGLIVARNLLRLPPEQSRIRAGGCLRMRGERHPCAPF